MNELKKQNAAQARTIQELWVKLTASEKSRDHAQAHISNIEAKLRAAQSQLTNEARADWMFTN
jgi:uncharacterized coiled-coil protein SlyX